MPAGNGVWWRRDHGGGGRLMVGTQIPFSRPRLRWTRDLHEKFVRAVNELGGAYEAKPKKILNIMRVDGLTLRHVKSHIQKFRDGRVAKRSLPPAVGQVTIVAEVPATNMEDGNPNHLVESQSSVGVTTENAGTENPVLPPIPASGNQGDFSEFAEWSGLVNEENVKPIPPGFGSWGNKSSSPFGSFFDEVARFPRIEDYEDDVYTYPGI